MSKGKLTPPKGGTASTNKGGNSGTTKGSGKPPKTIRQG